MCDSSKASVEGAEAKSNMNKNELWCCMKGLVRMTNFYIWILKKNVEACDNYD